MAPGTAYHPITLRRRAVTLLWPPAVVALLAAAVGRIGFNPTDEGMVLAYANRIVGGQVPHRDFITPRPVGASLLHMVDLFAPGPLLIRSHVITLAEMTTIAILFGVLVFRATPTRWTLPQTSLVLAALVIDLHTFPLMEWSTVDGVLLTLVGLVLLRPLSGTPPRLAQRCSGLFIAGAAVTMKQSFVLAPILASAVASWPALARGRPAFFRRFLGSGVIAAAPSAMYVGVLAALGAGPAMATQLTSQRDINPLAVFGAGGIQVVALLAAIVAVAGLGIWWMRATHPTWEPGARVAGAIAELSCLLILAFGRLSIGGNWGDELVQLLLVSTAVRALDGRRIDVDAILVAAIAWMTTLSYGYNNPDLVAGGVALVLVWRAAKSLDSSPIHVVVSSAWKRTTAGAVIAIVSLGASVAARTHEVYRDPPAAQLTASASTIPALSGIAIDPTTQHYLTDITGCIRRYPARSVAVLPDNQILYLTLGIHNPFPIDWMIPSDYEGSEERLIDAARALDARGSYLVLFQTIDATQLENTSLSTYEKRARATAADPQEALPYAPGVIQPLRDALHGRVVPCGAFVAVYSSGSSGG